MIVCTMPECQTTAGCKCNKLFWFRCPVCDYDSAEAGYLHEEKTQPILYCGLCASDNGRDVLCDVRLATIEDINKVEKNKQLQ